MSVNAQLRFDLIDDRDPSAGSREPDFIETMLEIHGGNYRAAMRELLLDADFLRDQLATAYNLMSHGFGRGWKPKYERL